MKSKLPLLIMILMLNGCKSEVDKCVDAFMEKSRSYDEARVRITCLKAQAGKD